MSTLLSPQKSVLRSATGDGLLVSFGKTHARQRRILSKHFEFANLKVKGGVSARATVCVRAYDCGTVQDLASVRKSDMLTKGLPSLSLLGRLPHLRGPRKRARGKVVGAAGWSRGVGCCCTASEHPE